MTDERECAVLLPDPVPGGRANADDGVATIEAVDGSTRIQAPGWIQFGGVPLARPPTWMLPVPAGHAVFQLAVAGAEHVGGHVRDAGGQTGVVAGDRNVRADGPVQR